VCDGGRFACPKEDKVHGWQVDMKCEDCRSGYGKGSALAGVLHWWCLCMLFSFKQRHPGGAFCFLKCPVSKARERAGDVLYVNMKSVPLEKTQRLLPG